MGTRSVLLSVRFKMKLLDNDKPKKKNKKLLLQVAALIIPMFLLMIANMTFAMYRNSVNNVLGGQNSFISDSLERMYGMIPTYIDSFMFDYWEKHPGMQYELNDDLLYGGLSDEDAEDLDENSYDVGCWTKDFLEKQSDAVQEYCAATNYRLLKLIQQYSITDEKYNSLFIIDINAPYEGFVFTEFCNKNGNRKLGEWLSFDIKDHPVLEDLLGSPSGDIVFEKTKDFVCSGSQYIGYKPIVVEGKVRAVIGMSYDWSDFQTMMFKSMHTALLIGIGGMALIMVALLFLLYRLAIKPVGRIQRSVRDYIETKDSKKVTDAMGAVKSGNEFGLLSDNIAELSREIDSYTAENVRLAGEKERVAAELDMAKNIQAGQLPSVFPAFPDRDEFDIYASMTPAKEVGGDFYDFFFIDNDHLGLVIADVSDKGVPAALFMMMSRILINNLASMGLEPHEVLERVNDKLCENNVQKMFVTVWFGVLDLKTGDITAVNAGHEYPIVRQPDGKFEIFREKHCFVVGGISGMKYKQYQFNIQPGGALFVYTDGVPEATDSQGEMFKLDRLIEALNKEPDASPDKLLHNVREAVDEFVGDAPQFDDLTMLGIKLN